MNILFLAQFPINPIKGGVQRVSYILATEFEKVNHQVLFFSLQARQKTDVNNKFLQLYSDSMQISDQKEQVSNTIKKYSIDVIINQAGIYKEISHIVAYIKNKHPKVKCLTVHHNCISCLNENYREIVLGNPGMLKNILKILDFRIVWQILKFRNRIKYKKLFQKAINVSDQLLLLAEIYKIELDTLGVSCKNKVSAISNPASFEAAPLSLNKKENRIVFVGRLSFTQKRVDVLMKVYKALHDSHSDWFFDIVGDGAQRDWMEKYKESKHLDRIHFHGFQDPIPFLRRAKIFTLTSDFEGFGMVLLEAQAYGVVPIVFPCFSAVNEVVGAGAGLVLEDSRPSSMIEAIDKLIDSPKTMNNTALKGLENVDRFKAEEIVQTWISLIDSMNYEE